MSDGVHVFFPRSLPPGLEPLAELALDLRWTWSHSGDRLWETIDPEAWQITENPWLILQNLPQERLDELTGDADFQKELLELVSQRKAYMEAPGRLDGHLGVIAYFSMEYGLGEALPLYAGGLGVLAGDYLKAASDLGVPVVAIGLLYQEGYFRQTVDQDGRQRAVYTYNEPTTLPIQPVSVAGGAWLRVSLDFPGRRVMLRVWQAQVGRVTLYLLDSNDPFNAPIDRGITGKLYGGGPEMRLMQEVVLGVAGWRVLEALGIDVEVCHLNEGHAALAVLERARSFMHKTNVGFPEALWATRAGNVFTTHTPVPAGFDRFDVSLVQKYLPDFQGYFNDLGLSLDDFMALGRERPDDPHEPFNMAWLAMRGCRTANGVSRVHGGVSRRMFRRLFPGWPEQEVPVGHVTNGVHVPSWDSPWADRLWTEACGPACWRGTTEAFDQALGELDDATFWSFCAQERQDLIGYVRRRLSRQLSQRGATAEAVAAAWQVLDPNVLIVGFARRFAEYKRPNLLLHDPERLGRLINHPERPIQIIVAGKAHPDDGRGVQLVQDWVRLASEPEFRRRVVFLEDYDIALAQQMVQGVDVWINTPRRPWEACGTSGMKVLVNGGLNLSELDGWWAEAYAEDVGWALDGGTDPSSGDDVREAECLYGLLEEEVTRLFYDRDAAGIPRGWVKRMRVSMATLAPQYSSNRMVEDYVRDYYTPAAKSWEDRRADGGRLALELRDWNLRVREGWPRLHFGEMKVAQENSRRRFVVPVYLCDLLPSDVRVELYAEPDETGSPLLQVMDVGEAIPGAIRGYLYQTVVDGDRPESDYTPRIVPFHSSASVPMESPLILWQR